MLLRSAGRAAGVHACTRSLQSFTLHDTIRFDTTEKWVILPRLAFASCGRPSYRGEQRASSVVVGSAVMGKQKRASEVQSAGQNKRLRRTPAEPLKDADNIVDESQYDAQLAEKRKKIEKMFSDMNLPEFEVFESAKSHYRQRAEFRVWQNKEDICYIMFVKKEEKRENGKDAHEKRRVDSFPVASEGINTLMKGLLDYIREQHILRHKLFQANFQTTLSEAMVTLVYHSALQESWAESAKELRQHLQQISGCSTLHIIGRSKNQKVCLDADFVEERMVIDGKCLIQKQVEGTFSQPNGGMCRHMLSWARDVTRDTDGELLELYCGNGNFTVALADNFRQVVATEVTKASVLAAKYNLEKNNIQNVHIARLSSEEFTTAWRGDREFYRMKDVPEIKGRKFKTLLVDPPRSGLDDETIELLKQFDNVVYISCNPHTLYANLQKMHGSHKIRRFAVFDQFPYTDHVECGVYLQRNNLTE